MHDAPSLGELIEAVKHFIDETATRELSGHSKFHARIASNVLAIVSRELTQRPSAEAGETARLAAFLGMDAALGADAMNAALTQEIEHGNINAETPGLLLHLKTTAIAQLKIDQPKYSGMTQFQETET